MEGVDDVVGGLGAILRSGRGGAILRSGRRGGRVDVVQGRDER